MPSTPAAFWSVLSSQSVIRFQGQDARRLLQGQVTCHLDELTPEHSLLGAACTPKGRAYASFRLLQTNDSLLLALDASLEAGFLSHLAKYAALFKVQLASQEDACILGICGADLAQQLSEDQPLPAAPGRALSLSHGVLVRVAGSQEQPDCFEFWTQASQQEDLSARLGSAQCTEESRWQLERIRAGQGWITAASRETWIPQMFNWHLLGGIHFRKGCYTGQEIIARMHFLGQLKKSLYRITFQSPTPATIGQSLLARQPDAEPVNAGELLNVVALDDQQYEGLAVITHSLADQPLYLAGHDDCPIRRLSLPYATPAQSETTHEPGAQSEPPLL